MHEDYAANCLLCNFGIDGMYNCLAAVKFATFRMSASPNRLSWRSEISQETPTPQGKQNVPQAPLKGKEKITHSS